MSEPNHDNVHCCDNLELLSSLADASIDLVYIDPPFNTGRDQTQSSHAYADRWGHDINAYLDFLRPRLQQIHRVLSDKGTLYVHLDWHAAHYVKVLLDDLMGPRQFLNEIIWHYRTGGLAKRWFGRKHDNILVYAKSMGQHTFNVQRHGRFRTDGMNYDAHGKPYKSTKSGRLYFHQDGPAMTDVWDLPFLSTVSSERTGYPSQKPVSLLERIVAASSNPGDLVADFFCGSGTTLVAAQRAQRRWLGCDTNMHAVTLSRQRLQESRQSSKTPYKSVPG